MRADTASTRDAKRAPRRGGKRSGAAAATTETGSMREAERAAEHAEAADATGDAVAPGTGGGAPPATPRPRFNRFIIPLAAFVAIAAVLGVGIINSRSVGVIQSPLIGKRAPEWSLPVLDQAGRTFGSKDLAGKWYVLNVWGSWCYACKDEHPELLAISRSTSVPLIGIDWNDTDAQARDYLNSLGNPYETLTADHDGHVVVDWGVYGAPETFLVNPAGVVVYKQIGPITPAVWEKEFAARLPHDLTAPRGTGGAS